MHEASRANPKLTGSNGHEFGREPKDGLSSRLLSSEPIWPQGAWELAAIVEHSNDAVFSRRLDGTIATWNNAAERIFGFRAEEILDRSSKIILPRGHRDEFKQLVTRIKGGELVRHFETERLRKDGRRIVVSLTLSPIRDAMDRLVGFSTIARDITEQRRAQEALQRSERALADLFEEASVGLAWSTAKGRVLRVNRALLELLECKAEHCLGRTLGKFHPDPEVISELAKRLAGRETVRNFQTTFRAWSGNPKDVLIDASAFWEGGKVVHFRWFVRDITRRKQLEREVLSITERERAGFSRELHDGLGQQLSGITYLANVLRERLLEGHSAEAGAAQRIFRLLKQAIEQARTVARGLSPVGAEPQGLCSALKELTAQTTELFGMTCRFRCPKPVLVAESEAANHLYRIAQEGVHNALEHGHAKRITISLAHFHGLLRMKILDDGVGIGTLSPRRKGLGLRIMQYRAGLLQGTAYVRRRPKGGTEVCCSAPVAVLPPRATRP
jgi:PAS domain S-box-containing protein